jgi:hypothetical protein
MYRHFWLLGVGDGLGAGDDVGLGAGDGEGLADGAGPGDEPALLCRAELDGVAAPGVTFGFEPAAVLRRDGCGSGAPARGADPCTWLCAGPLSAAAG